MNEEQLKYPLDSKSVEILKGFLDNELPSKIFNINWNSHFYFSTMFESLDRWLTSGTGSGLINSDGLNLKNKVGALDDWALGIATGSLLDYSKKSRFRLATKIDVVANAFLAIYTLNDATSNNYYGISIEAGVIKGNSKYKGTETSINLTSVGNNTFVTLEAQYSPHDGVIFFVDGVQRGKIVKNLPDINASPKPNSIVQFVLETTGADKTAIISYFEFSQEEL